MNDQEYNARQKAILEAAKEISNSIEHITRAAMNTGDELNQRELMRGLQFLKRASKKVEAKII
jgi:hypothetical protein